MMTSQLSLWQELLLLGTGLLSLVYVFYFRIWLALAISSDVLFAISVALVVATIATPSLFDDIAHGVVERSSLPSALEDADARVAAFAALPGEMIDAALAKVGFEPDPELLAANGQKLRHLGAKTVPLVLRDGTAVQLTLQVCDVRQPIASVGRFVARDSARYI